MNKVKTKLIFLLFFFISFRFFLFAKPEYYSKYSLKHKIDKDYSLKLSLSLRIRDWNNYYRKFYGGLSKKISKKIKIGFYYAKKFKKSKIWKNYDFIFPEITYKNNIKNILLEDRNRIEYFFSSKEYRYRNRIKINYPLRQNIIIWIGDEFRYFFKDNIIGKNEILAGIKFKINKKVNFEIFYDYKS